MKTIVYIDGQNFLYKLAERLVYNGVIRDKQDLTAIDIPYLVSRVLPEENMTYKYYGVTRINRQEQFGEEILDKSIKFADNLRRIRNCLRATDVEYRAVGRLKVRDRDECKHCGATDYKFQEKGVDVGMAVEMVRDVLEDNVEHLVLISSDTDLAPAIKLARAKGAEITYLAFANQITQLISALANSTQTFRDDEIVEAYSRMNKSR